MGHRQIAEAALSRAAKPTVFTVAEYRAPLGEADSSGSRMASQPRILVFGTEDDLR